MTAPSGTREPTIRRQQETTTGTRESDHSDSRTATAGTKTGQEVRRPAARPIQRFKLDSATKVLQRSATATASTLPMKPFLVPVLMALTFELCVDLANAQRSEERRVGKECR